MLPGATLIGFVLFFAGMWIAISFAFSRMAGWSGLAARYPAAQEPAGQRLIWITAQVGWVTFRTCLNVTLSADGFYMVPALMFRLFMPPLLIPWTDVRFEGFKDFLFFRFACCRLGGPGGPLLAVWHKTGLLFRPYLTEESRAALDGAGRYDGPLFTRSFLIVMAAFGALGALVSVIASYAGRR